MTGGLAARARGFTLVELLVATTIALTIAALACTAAIAAQRTWRSDSARNDLQQRARAAVEVLSRVLLDAGAGAPYGPAQGSLLRVLAPVVPYRLGVRGADPAGTFRSDAFTVVSVVPDAEPASSLLPVPAGLSTIELSPGCSTPSCGFSRGDTIVLADLRGNHDFFSVVSAEGPVLALQHHGPGAHASYPAGSPVLRVHISSISLDAGASILRIYDGDASDLPLLDDVVGMRVEYVGDRQPPRWPRSAAGVGNCLYEADGTYREDVLSVLQGALPRTPLTAERLTDGPWCGAGASAFDADLLRVRQVRIVLRLQASDPAVRGRDPAQFAKPGTAAASAVPDASVVIDVRLRNFHQGW